MKLKPADACNKVEMWLVSRTSEANANGVVVGMSGGVDSSVTGVLAKRALGDKVLGLILPCDSDPKDAARAQMLAEKFGIRTETIDLTAAFHELRKILPSADVKTLGNLKARLRACALYHYANKDCLLVLGTSNKSEIAIGYFTKHGDGAADLEPLGGLYKTQVVEIARHLELPDDIINALPTAGLWNGQTDEGEIGMKYIELDSILHALERNKEVTADAKKLARLKDLIKKSSHKRKMPDMCVI
jgi:NAD+ synthase